MDIQTLLADSRAIWGDQKLTIEEIIVRQGVAMGDISRYARDQADGKPVDQNELKKELGNILFSTIRWCDDLGLNAEECIELAKQAQTKFKAGL